jgi:hypothetical protein
VETEDAATEAPAHVQLFYSHPPSVAIAAAMDNDDPTIMSTTAPSSL